MHVQGIGAPGWIGQVRPGKTPDGVAAPVDVASLSAPAAAAAPTGLPARPLDPGLDVGLASALAHPALPGAASITDLPRGVWRFLFHRPLDPAVKQRLMDEATDPSNAGRAWPPGTPLSAARNAHYTNTADEMLQSLLGDYNFLEGDFRLEAGLRRLPVLDRWREPIAAHDTDHVDGLTLSEWLDLGVASGRGLKIDIKQAAAVPKILAEVKKRNIPEERLIFNADVIRGPGGRSRLVLAFARLTQDLTCGLDELKEIRRQFPRATIALGAYTGKTAPGTRYSAKQVERFKEIAREVGGPTMFVLRAELVDAGVVAKLRPAGRVGIWNDPSTYSPVDVDADAKRFRAMGVDGVIDLRQR